MEPGDIEVDVGSRREMVDLIVEGNARWRVPSALWNRYDRGMETKSFKLLVITRRAIRTIDQRTMTHSGATSLGKTRE